MKNKKLVFIESLLKNAGGHHMDNLIETTLYFKKNNDIHWLVNENFESKNLYLPDNVILDPYIPDENKDFLKKIKNFFFLILIFIQEKALFKFIKIFCKSIFSYNKSYNFMKFIF